MESLIIILWFTLISLIASIFFFNTRNSKSYKNLPPGPPGLPVFGNLFDLGTEPYKKIAAMKEKYGPVVWLTLGPANSMMVIQTAEVASELFKNHDVSFASRQVNEVHRINDYATGGSVALAEYGPYWRVMRRVCTIEMFTAKKINETIGVRRKCVDDMITWIEKDSRQTGLQGDNNNMEKCGAPDNGMVTRTGADSSQIGPQGDNNNMGKCGAPVSRMTTGTGADSSQTGPHGIEVGRFVFLTSFNMLGNLILSRDLVNPESKETTEFFNAMMKITVWSGQANVSDIFPWLKWLDLQGLKRKMMRDMGKTMEIAAGFLRERLEEEGLVDGPMTNKNKKKDFLSVLMNFRGNGKDEPYMLSQHQTLIFILEMFLAGTETTSSTVEWAMTELLRKPETMAKAKAEIRKVLEGSSSSRKLEESDLENLPYLQAVIKETLRLHPPLPFLIPRKGAEDIKFMGYDIPKGTNVYVNVWAIGRDPKCWEDPNEFMPERFVDSKDDFKGQHFELIPFGAGRRVCVGLPLGNRMLHFVLGSLLSEFDWELESGVDPKCIDMRDKIGMAVRKLHPLKAIPRKVNR